MHCCIKNGALLVWRKHNKKIFKESTLWHHMRKELLAQGVKCVRQVPAKDGHLTGMPFYLKLSDGRAVIDQFYAVRNPCEQYNNGLTLQFSIVA